MTGDANMSNDEERSLTQYFSTLPMDVDVKEPAMPTKDRFLSCNLVVPGIALKKMAMCLASGDEDHMSKIAVLGMGGIKQHRVERNMLKGMVIGDFFNDKHAFWKSAVKHLHHRKIGGVMVFSNFPENIEAASWLQASLVFGDMLVPTCGKTFTFRRH